MLAMKKCIYCLIGITAVWTCLRCVRKNRTTDKHDEISSAQREDYFQVRRNYFLSVSLVYFIGSAILIQTARNQVESVNMAGMNIPWISLPEPTTIIISYIIFVWALILVISAIINTNGIFIERVYEYSIYAAPIPMLFFGYGFIMSVVGLINKGISPWFVWPYVLTGWIIYGLIFWFHIRSLRALGRR